MDKEALKMVLELQQKVDFYERAFLDLLFLLVFDYKSKSVSIPKHDDVIVNECFNLVQELKRAEHEKVQ